MRYPCIYSHTEIPKSLENRKDIIKVTCVHGKTLGINQARAVLGLPLLSEEQQEEILRQKALRRFRG